MTIPVELSQGEETRLRREARRRGQDLQTYIRREVASAATTESASDQEHAGGQSYDADAGIALLDAFATSDEWGTAEEQQETLDYLMKAVDRDRPGQRRVFGPGTNP